MTQKRPALTDKQARTLQAIRECKRDEGRTPTRLELAERTGQKHQTAVENHLRALQHKGYIRLGRGMGRIIVVVDDILPILDRPPASSNRPTDAGAKHRDSAS